MSLTLVLCIVKLIPVVKKIREKQEIPLTQNFIDTFHENFEFGMTENEIETKLGQPLKILNKTETKTQREEDYTYSYTDSREWQLFDKAIRSKEGYKKPKKTPNSCYVYSLSSEKGNLIYIYFTDGYFSALNIQLT